ncbi:MAG: flavodoxin-dependent (E)-4-hydroxy-3-methylbut-2-enyl-diphosphate synthase [Candidatus Brocadiia bacterium]|nr:flavodoxin-dependent (E)-4-hydroxy-3-methylbut-2-enyl-diphosphate synthase [Candidatus Brocadiia bacterium]
MERRKTRAVQVGGITIGAGAPVSVQSMTKTHTEEASATLQQIRELADIGCEIIRCAVPSRKAGAALEEIVRHSPLPVIADCHFDHRLAILALESGAHGVRVNPGNMSDEDGLREVFRRAAAAGRKVRIGVNSGSVRPRRGLEVKSHEGDLAELMVREALRCCELAESEGCGSIVLSLKASDVPTTIRAYRLAAQACDYPLHLGVTAAGPPEASLVRSAVGIGTLLAEGIGDTIRVSMTGPPHAEVEAALKILQSLGLRPVEGPEILSCPTCGRCMIDLVGLTLEVGRRLKGSRKKLKVAIMGCVVNGPGEAAEADVGIAGGGDFGYVFRAGKRVKKVEASALADALLAEIDSMD